MSILRQRKGFTLIELLVVVVIIGILAAVAVPSFLGARDDADAASAKAAVANGILEAKAYAADADNLTGFALSNETDEVADVVASSANEVTISATVSGDTSTGSYNSDTDETIGPN